MFFGCSCNCIGLLFFRALGDSFIVTDDAFEDRKSKGVAVLTRGDEASIKRMVYGTTFQKSTGYFDIAIDCIPRTIDPTVEEAHTAEHGGVKGGGKRNIFGISGVTGVLLKVTFAEFLIH